MTLLVIVGLAALISSPIFIVVVAVIASNRTHKKKLAAAETVDCPTCGHAFKLINGSCKCPKCRSRVTRSTNGDLVVT